MRISKRETAISHDKLGDIPKADLHMRAETRARLDHLVSRRDNKAPHDWAEELRRLADAPPGMERLRRAFFEESLTYHA